MPTGEPLRLAVLGSTGSIGRQTLQVVEAFPERLSVVALAAGRDAAGLAEQARRFGVSKTALGDVKRMAEMAADPEVDVVVVATPGFAGLLPTLRALEAGKRVALANKEVLVAGGELLGEAARVEAGRIRPIDSEHSALWQCLRGEEPSSVARLILTASGGPFRRRSMEELAQVTPEEALAHPTWRMGPKVTVDSATLMNKGFEVIEAHHLYGLPYDRIEVALHPQSVIHSMVEFVDGSVKAQLGPPDMRLPILYALAYPERWPASERIGSWRRMTVEEPSQLDLGPVDTRRFPCLSLAVEAGRRGGLYPAVLSAADEVAVEAFLGGRLPFDRIGGLVEQVLGAFSPRDAGSVSLDSVLWADRWAREQARALLEGSPRRRAT